MNKRNVVTPPPATVHIADQLLADQLADPVITTLMRTNLRSWFLSAYAVEGSAFDWSGPLDQQKRNYEVLDELLATCTRKALNTPDRFKSCEIDVEECLAQDFHDALAVLDIRRTLRVWFLKSLETQEHNIGSTHEVQVDHYEVLDEFLSGLIEKYLTEAQQAAPTPTHSQAS